MMPMARMLFVAILLSTGVLAIGIGDSIPSASAHACPLTQGYWKNHPEAWRDVVNGGTPVTSLTIGGTVYTKAQLLEIFNTPVAGDASINLAHQLIAALLNQLNGSINFNESNPQVQNQINTAVSTGLGLLNGVNLLDPNYSVSPSSPTGQQMVAAAGALAQFNEGQLTQGICGTF